MLHKYIDYYYDDYNDDHFDVYNVIFQSLTSEATAHVIGGDGYVPKVIVTQLLEEVTRPQRNVVVSISHT